MLGQQRPARGQLHVVNVATPSKNPASRLAKRSKVEIIKEKSDYLRHPLMEELVNDATFITEDSVQLMKFHGSYQQDHREKRAFGQGKAYCFMMRTRQPAGVVPNRLYLVMDDLADQYGNGTLRLTTRQAYQLHGVLKKDLKTVFSSVIKNMGSTLAACGDVNRNVMGPAAPYTNRPDYAAAQKAANDIADLLTPQSGAYYDVWLDGEKFMSAYKEDPKVTADRAFNGFGTNFENSPEPIYGAQFLPRKFKIATTVPGDNSVDLFTQDVGVVVIMDETGKEVKGYNLTVGGGMGRTHRDDETFPRLADPLGYVDKDDLFHAIKAVVAVQRDYGRRDNRKQARLKYLVHEWGIDRFRSVTEQYFGKKFQEFKPLPAWEYKDYLGWGEQGDGKLFYGIYVQNGRIKGEAKKALRAVIEKFNLPVILTPHQNIILRDVEPATKEEVVAMLRAGGVQDLVDWDSVDRLSMACPAMPLCGLAVTEAERGLPDINKRLRAMLTKVGLPADQELHVRMTGCPNGCARPYMAELGFVGDGPNSYQLYFGGNTNQTRLAQLYADRVKVKDLETTLEPIFAAWKANRRPKESFGDWVSRIGFDAVKTQAAAAAASLPAPAAPAAAPAANGNGNGAAPAAAAGKQLATK
ncbi:hypothetical protein HYH02_013193 [Chlamydomonas schloesseri]|uniref:assimilatory sulfite reductase (ferredoxin) n=1 Tax=Chlamydomonas schloesseri TaxID=2026947 RepID=A0A835SRH2_9CHLO|nr:hypothetical protein HYH02_013193 [Chlamydomonas schloesseri]|eukprot:KAG2431977.1 hypothetical protein HYH02_013193 [Chlamydomonas schloesseri]